MTPTVFKKKIHSEIILAEQQINDCRKGNEATIYFPVYIRTVKKHKFALFTQAEINRALARAAKHPEQRKLEHREYWLSRLLKFALW